MQPSKPAKTSESSSTIGVDGFDLASFLPYRLSLLSNTISQGIADTYQKDFDLTVTEWRIVAVLGGSPGISAKEVSSLTGMDKVAVSRAVNRLLDKALVARTAHDEDRRRMQMRLTPRGQRLYVDIIPRARRYEAQLMNGLSRGDRDSLNRLLLQLQQIAETI